MNRKLNSNDIVNKEFSIDYKGYNAEEVDKFLDIIFEDYQVIEKQFQTFLGEIQNLISENNNKEEKIQKINLELNNLKKQKEILEQKGVHNVDIITRLSKLESIVHDD